MPNRCLPVDRWSFSAGWGVDEVDSHDEAISNNFLITGAGGQVCVPRSGEASAKLLGCLVPCVSGVLPGAGLFAYFLGGFFVFQIAEPEACDQMYESLARLHSNYYKHKVSGPDLFISPALGLEVTNERE